MCKLAAGDAFDACVHRPRACFELQLTVFDTDLARTFLLLLEFRQKACAHGGCEVTKPRAARGQHNYEEQVQTGHRGLREFPRATRSTALLARGLALISSAPGLAGRPMMRRLEAQLPGP